MRRGSKVEKGGAFITGLPEQLVVKALDPRLDELRFPGVDALGADGPLPGGVSAVATLTSVAEAAVASRELRELMLCAQGCNVLVAYVWYLVLDTARTDERESAASKAALFRRISSNWVLLLFRLMQACKPGVADREGDALAAGLCSSFSDGALRALALGLPRDAHRLGGDAKFVGRAHGQLRAWTSGFELALPSPPRAVVASSPRQRLRDAQDAPSSRRLRAPRTPRPGADAPQRAARPVGEPHAARGAPGLVGSAAPLAAPGTTPKAPTTVGAAGSLSTRTALKAPAAAASRPGSARKPSLAGLLFPHLAPRALALPERAPPLAPTPPSSARGLPGHAARRDAAPLAPPPLSARRLSAPLGSGDDAARLSDDDAAGRAAARAQAGRAPLDAEPPHAPSQPPELRPESHGARVSMWRHVARGARADDRTWAAQPAGPAAADDGPTPPTARDFSPLDLSQLRRRQRTLEAPSALAVPTPPPTRTRLHVAAPSPAVAEWLAARSPRAASTPATPRVSTQRSVPQPPPAAAQARKMGAQTYRELLGESRARCAEWAKAYGDVQDATARELAQLKKATRAELAELEAEKQRVLELETREYANQLTSAFLMDAEARARQGD